MYGFAGAGPAVKHDRVVPDVQGYVLLRRHDTNGCTALGSVTAWKIAQEKPPPLWVCSQGIASKDAGVPGSQDANRKLWAILPFAHGMEPATGMAPPRKQIAWMDALVPCFSLPTTVLTESRPRRISQSTDYAREAEATGL